MQELDSSSVVNELLARADCKGISGIDSATDALEMELEEFHDFVKDAKLETRMINFTVMENVFAKVIN